MEGKNMLLMFDEEPEQEAPLTRIKVIGVGGGGGNAVNNMVRCGLKGVEFIAANTDVQVLRNSLATHKVQLGAKRTRGQGAGAHPEVGKESAVEASERIKELLVNTDMVFITAGMGGGTGTGAAPVIAAAAKEMGILTAGVVTQPFQFEGLPRKRNADEGILEMKKACHTVIVIPNQLLLSVIDKTVPIQESFQIADDVLRQAVQGVSDLITIPGLINVDFADVRTTMSHTGRAVMGIGSAKGPNRAIEAAEQAIHSPFLSEGSIEGARGVLINVTGGRNLSLHEADEAASRIQKMVDPSANIICGFVVDQEMTDEVTVTVIATGFADETEEVVKKGFRLVPNKGEIKVHNRGGGSRWPIREKEKFPHLTAEESWDVPTFLRKQID